MYEHIAYLQKKLSLHRSRHFQSKQRGVQKPKWTSSQTKKKVYKYARKIFFYEKLKMYEHFWGNVHVF